MQFIQEYRLSTFKDLNQTQFIQKQKSESIMCKVGRATQFIQKHKSESIMCTIGRATQFFQIHKSNTINISLKV